MNRKLTYLAAIVVVVVHFNSQQAFAWLYDQMTTTYVPDNRYVSGKDDWNGAAVVKMVLDSGPVAKARRSSSFTGMSLANIHQDIKNFNAALPGYLKWDPEGIRGTLLKYDPTGYYTDYSSPTYQQACNKLIYVMREYEVPPAIMIDKGKGWAAVLEFQTDVDPQSVGYTGYNITGFLTYDPNKADENTWGAKQWWTYNGFKCYFNKLNKPWLQPPDCKAKWHDRWVVIGDPEELGTDLPAPREYPIRGEVISMWEGIDIVTDYMFGSDLIEDPTISELFLSSEPAEPLIRQLPTHCDQVCLLLPYVQDGNYLTMLFILHAIEGSVMSMTYAEQPSETLENFYALRTYPFPTVDLCIDDMPTDLNHDCCTDVDDLLILVDHWMECVD